MNIEVKNPLAAHRKWLILGLKEDTGALVKQPQTRVRKRNLKFHLCWNRFPHQTQPPTIVFPHFSC